MIMYYKNITTGSVQWDMCVCVCERVSTHDDPYTQLSIIHIYTLKLINNWVMHV